MMNGRKTVLDLLPVIKSLGLKVEDVQALVAQGLLEPAPSRSGRSRKLTIDMLVGAVDVPGEAARAASFQDTQPHEPVVEELEPPAAAVAPRGTDETAVTGANAHWLRVARLFALDLLTHMLERPRSDWHDRLQAVDSAPALMEWIDDCALYLAAVAGAERADRFRMQVVAFVPPVLRGPGTLADMTPGRRALLRDSPDLQADSQPATGPGALAEER
jgi:hypothetical protein